MATLVDFFSTLLPKTLYKFWNCGNLERWALIEENSSRYVLTGTIYDPELNDACAICISQYVEGEEVRELKCKHRFHMKCIDTWFENDPPSCPLCRHEVIHRFQNDDECENTDDEMEPLTQIAASALFSSD